MIFESHCHLDDNRFDGDREAVVSGFRAQGISTVLNVGYDLGSSARSIALAKRFPEIFAAVGIHPHDAAGVTEEDWGRLRELAGSAKVVALGEMGLDYYRDLSPRTVQKEVFCRQLCLANELSLPVIVHNRDAHGDVMAILKANTPLKGGVLHCFSGSWESAELALGLGLYISFAGPLTYKNAVNLQAVALKVPLDRLLVETDSPYLTPEPFRGRRNEPANVRLVLEKLAELRGLHPVELGRITSQNGARLFGIGLNA